LSQLFDSLRRGRQTRAGQSSARTAQGDAVLATLGYAPTRRRGRSVPRVAQILLLGGAIASSWIVWRILGRDDDARVPARAVSSSARTSAVVASDAVSGSRPEPFPPVKPAVVSAAGFPVMSPERAPGPVHAEAVRPVSFMDAIPAPPPASTAAPSAPIAPPPARRVPALEARAAAAPLGPPSPVAAVEPAVAPVLASNDLDLALYFHRAGDFENALQHYRALLVKNELNAQAHNNLGLLYQDRNLLDESARELQRAIVIEPRNAAAHNNYGVTLLKLGRPDEAMAEFDVATALSPRSVDPIVNRALAQRDAHQPGVAKETLLRALTIEPRNPAAHYNLAQLYDQTNETAGAVEHYRRFLENAGAEYASHAAAVRARIEALTRDPD
jgi:Tfp pilus assembly protein PilF